MNVKIDPRVDDALLEAPQDQVEALYFDSRGRRLFGWVTSPARPRGEVGVVVCKPFGYEAICAHRAMRVLAERLAALGIPCLRFDYAGTGDSADLDAAADQIDVWSEDVVAAAGELKRRTGVRRIVLVGIRLGAALALLAARRVPVDALALIAPTLSGRRYLREFKASRLASQMLREQSRTRRDTIETTAIETREDQRMEVAGFAISPATVTALGEVDLTTIALPPAPHLLVLDARGFATASTWAARLAEIGPDVTYREMTGAMEMVMSAPQFGMSGGEVVSAVVDWMVQLARTPMAVPSRDAPRPRNKVSSADEALVGQGGWYREVPIFIPAEVALFGILTRPRSQESRRRAVILLNAGADSHVGPGRMYVSLARGWARHGYLALRLDLAGIGDSDTRPGHADDVVFTNEALDDTRAAIDFLRLEYGIRDITLAGLCSGAYHALRAGMEGLPANRLVMVNPLNFFSNRDAQHSELKLAEVVGVPSRYRARLFSFRHWGLLLRGQVSLWRILTIYVQRMILALEAQTRDLLRRLRVHLPGDLGRELQTIASRGVSMVFVFARGEPGIDLLKLQAGSVLQRLGPQCRVHIIDSGDHIFGRSGARSILEGILSEELFAPAPWYAASQREPLPRSGT